MIVWTSINQGVFRRVLIEFYSSNSVLRQFVRDYFEQPIDNLPALEVARPVWAEALLEEAASAGWIGDLYQKFCLEHLIDSRVTQLKKDLKDPSLEASIGDSSSDRFVMQVAPDEPLLEDPRSAHLVIAVFWQEQHEKIVRIAPILYYRNSKSDDKLEKERLVENECSISLKKFPEFLKTLIDPTIQKLEGQLNDSLKALTLTIELFVPTELLGEPLTTWCGKNQGLIRMRSIVLGCSDRFDNRRSEAANLRNQMKAGWVRFKRQVPDTHNSNLKNLSWLSSHVAHQEAFEDYSGFQCYGHWLKPGEPFVKNWSELVESGIPLALWMCEGIPQQQMMGVTFESLVDCTRFEFLERIRKTRDRLQKTCDHNIGIFYEDPNYVPEALLPPEIQFFEVPGL